VTSLGDDAVDVAPWLLGRRLAVVGSDGVRRALRVTEVEAYTVDDPASHSFRGPTKRNSAMFGEPGHWYVYLIYGVHWCMNVVTGAVGDGQAVLLRAAVVDGVGAVSGPGRLTRVLAVDRSVDGASVELLADDGWRPASVAVTPRVGITKAVDWPRRWLITDAKIPGP
jgi:DNA-3-methyladenine glycosylase